jgi:hypothetical protein
MGAHHVAAGEPVSPGHLGDTKTTSASSATFLQKTLSSESHQSQAFGEAMLDRSEIYEEALFENEVLQSDTASLATADEDSPWAQKSILCLDGGGIRGYSSLLILQALMQEIETLERAASAAAHTSADSPLIGLDRSQAEPLKPESKRKPSSEFLPCHYFDYIAGTSTGGLIAIMLGRLRMSAETCLDEYTSLSTELFGNPRHAGLKQLRGIFRTTSRSKSLALKLDQLQPGLPSPGEGVKKFESDSSRCRTIVCSMERSVNKDVITPFLFRTYGHPHKAESPFERNPGVAASYDISEVVQATIATSPQAKSTALGSHRYFDAGLGLNNPSLEIYNEIDLMHPQLYNPVNVFLSLGCGYARTEHDALQAGSRAWKTRQSHNMLENTLASISDAVHEKMVKESSNFHYYRLDVKDGLNLAKLGESGRSALERISHATMLYLKGHETQETIKRCARELVERRRQRSNTMRWESFALGIRYRCKHDDKCSAQNGKGETFHNRNELLDHLRIVHKMAPPDANNYESIRSLIDKGRTKSGLGN